MGSGSSIIQFPDKLDLEQCRAVTGEKFSREIFDAYKDETGFISKDKLIELGQKTDVFCTHDWGDDELDRNNHDRVQKINESLKARGLITWFDSDRMKGNIIQQMCSGIDNAQCIIVFVTKKYMEKVGGTNANDNCQLEFQYALRQKSASLMLAVVMEPGMRFAAKWTGALGMALGGSIYIDFCDDNNFENKCNEVFSSVTKIIKPLYSTFTNVTTITTVLPAAMAAVTTTAPTSGYKPLKDLTVDEVCRLLESLNLSNFTESFKVNKVDGNTLLMVDSFRDIVEFGVNLTAKAKVLHSHIESFRAHGVKQSMIGPLNSPEASSKQVPEATVLLPQSTERFRSQDVTAPQPVPNCEPKETAKEVSQAAETLHYKKNGTLDMRYKSSQANSAGSIKYKVVYAPNINVRAGIDMSSNVIETLPCGSTVIGTGEEGSSGVVPRIKIGNGWISEYTVVDRSKLGDRCVARVECKYRILLKAIIRDGPDLDKSSVVGSLDVGDEVYVSDAVSASGVVRLKIENGWVSLNMRSTEREVICEPIK